MNLFVLLVFLLASGVFGVLHRIPLKDIGKHFYRFVTVHYLVGMTVVLAFTHPDQPSVRMQYSLVLGATVTGFLYYFLLLGSRDSLRSGVYWMTELLLVGVFLSFAFGAPFPELVESFVSPWLTFFHLIVTAAILGAILNGMMCGHWYLVNPDLNLIPIKAISRAFTVVLLGKIALVAASLVLTKIHDPYLFKKLVFWSPVLFWVRLLVGLSGGLFFNWMNWRAIEYGNTQASTGILYACIVWVVLGEFSGFYLTIQTGVPL